MPTQEEINIANAELQTANDNYAAMADRYNKFQQLFKRYASESKEVQDKAAPAIGYALEEFEKLKLDMYAAEDRIQQAQNRVNEYNEIIASQPVKTSTQWGQRRRQVNNHFWWKWWTNNSWTLTSADWQTIVYPDWSIQFWVEPAPQPAPGTVLETIPEQKPALLWYQSPMSDYSKALINKGNSVQYTPTQPNQSRVYPVHVNWYTWRLWNATITPKGYVDNNLRWTRSLNTWWSGVWTL